MQPGTPGPGQDPYQQNPYQQPYPTNYGQVPPYSDPFAPQSAQPYSTPPAAEQYPTTPSEYSLYPPQPQYPQAPPPYPPAGYAVPPMPMAGGGPNSGNTLGLLSMIFGIVSIPLLFCCYLGLPMGIAAIVLGILGVNKANNGQATNKGMSMAGIICGAVTFVILIVIILLYAVAGIAALPSTKY